MVAQCLRLTRTVARAVPQEALERFGAFTDRIVVPHSVGAADSRLVPSGLACEQPLRIQAFRVFAGASAERRAPVT